MEEVNVISPREIKRIMDKFCLHPHKKWGQNFLADANIVNKILHEAELQKDDMIVEIGPGLGALTLPLVKRSAFVIAVEIDRGLVHFLNILLASYENRQIIEGDVRRLDLPALCREVRGEGDYPVKLVANLPYYITSPFIYNLITGEPYWEKAVLMVQKEVALRLQAPLASPHYGALSVLCQCFFNLRTAFTVSPHVFYPPPRVESAVVSLEPAEKDRETGIENREIFVQFVSRIFRHRRKTLINSINHNFEWDRSFIHRHLKEANIDPGTRPELLSVAQFANLCRLFYN